MSGYVIADVEVQDAAAYDEYRKLVAPTIEKHGGKFVVRAGAHEVMEGDWTPNRVIVLEFESVARAKEWYSSEEYAPVRAIRLKAAKSSLIIVEGA